MSPRSAVTALGAVAPPLSALLLALNHGYAAIAALGAGLLSSLAAVVASTRGSRGRTAAWTAFAANALLVALGVAVALFLLSDSS